jgi:acyl carrier protein
METEFCINLQDAIEIESKEIELTDRFREYDEWDSLSQLSLIAMLDEEYGVEIESEDFKNLITVQDLLDEVKIRMEKNE